MTNVLAIDRGTPFDTERHPVRAVQQKTSRHFPASGSVEHDPEDPRTTAADTCQIAIDGPRVLETKALSVASWRPYRRAPVPIGPVSPSPGCPTDPSSPRRMRPARSAIPRLEAGRRRAYRLTPEEDRDDR